MKPETGDSSPKPRRAGSQRWTAQPPATSTLPPREGRCPPQGIGVSETNRSSQLPGICFGGCPHPGTGTSDSRWAQLKPRAGTARTPLCSWRWPLGCGMFPLLFPAAFNGIWVKHQFMDYGWVEKATCPSLEYKQIKRQKSTKKNECPYSWKKRSQFGDKESPLPLATASCTGGSSMCFPSLPH